jgi:hypothetical protein
MSVPLAPGDAFVRATVAGAAVPHRRAPEQAKNLGEFVFKKTENHVYRWNPVFYLSANFFVSFEFGFSKTIPSSPSSHYLQISYIF